MTHTQARYLAEVWSSSVDKHSVDGEIPVQLCNYTDVYKNDTVAPHAGLMRATASPEEVSRFRLQRGDTVLTKDSEDPSDIGISAFVTDAAPGFICGYHLAIARPRIGTHPRFLNWSLRARPALSHFSVHASGISRYGLGVADLRATPISVHDEEQQRRIADFLDHRIATIDQIIAARQRQVASLDSLRQSIPDRLLADYQESWVRLGLLVRRIEQGWSPQCEAFSARESEWGVLKVGAVQPGWFDASENKRLPESEEPRPEYEIKGGDLLVSRANTPERVGFFTVVPEDVRAHLILCDKIMRIDLDPGLVAGFVALVGQSRSARDSFILAGTGTSGSMVNIRGDDVRNLRVPLLSIQAQREAVEIWSRESAQLQSHAGSMRATVDLLLEYKQSLITAAVTGELDVTTAGSGIPG